MSINGEDSDDDESPDLALELIAKDSAAWRLFEKDVAQLLTRFDDGAEVTYDQKLQAR